MAGETGGWDGYPPHGLLYLPAKGQLTRLKGKKGPAISLPNPQDSMPQGFPRAKGLARLNPLLRPCKGLCPAAKTRSNMATGNLQTLWLLIIRFEKKNAAIPEPLQPLPGFLEGTTHCAGSASPGTGAALGPPPRGGLRGAPVLPNTCSLSFGLRGHGSLQRVNLPVPSNQVKPGHALSPGGDTSEAPITRAALAMGGLPLITFLSLSVLRRASSAPSPGRLIKTRAALSWRTRRASRASGTGTAPAQLLVLRQQQLLEVVVMGPHVKHRLDQQIRESGCPKAGCSLLWSRGLGSFRLLPVPHTPASPSLPSLSSRQHGGALILVKHGFSISTGPPKSSSCLQRAATILPTLEQLRGRLQHAPSPHPGLSGTTQGSMEQCLAPGLWLTAISSPPALSQRGEGAQQGLCPRGRWGSPKTWPEEAKKSLWVPSTC